MENRTGNCLCACHVPQPISRLDEWEGLKVFYISLTVPLRCDLPKAGLFQSCFERYHFYSVLFFSRELNLLQDYKSMKRIMWIFTLVSFSVQSSDFLQLELWKVDTNCITVTEVIYPPHAVLCNSISHLAWAEGDTQKSIPIATPQSACPIENSAV